MSDHREYEAVLEIEMKPGPCGDCYGNGEVRALLNLGGTCKWASIKCRACKGEGTITPERAEAVNAGRARSRDRIDRGLSLREEAERLGMTPMELSRLEHP